MVEPSHSHRVTRLAVTYLELLVMLMAAPLLLFPTFRPRLTGLALAGLVFVYLVRWILCKETWPSTPFNGALLLLALTIPVAVWASALPDLTIPKLTGLILGLAAFRLMVLSVNSRRDLGWAVLVFLAVGFAILVVGALGTGWSAKIQILQPVVSRLPKGLVSLPDVGGEGINANQLAGALMLYLPFVVACMVGYWQEQRKALAFVGLAGAGIVTATLLVTQSRSGWIGGIAGLAALPLMWGLLSGRRWLRRLALLVPVGLLLVAAGAILLWGPDRLGEVALKATASASVSGAVGQISLSDRPEIWSRALYAIQDFPFTGTGLGTFRKVVPLLYPLFTISPDVDIAHAHDIFLQVAVDLGLPGLIAYLALLGVAGVAAWSVARRASPWPRSLALGVLAGLIGLHVYGLTDALALGSKPGIAFWMALGLIAALVRNEEM